MSKNVKSNKPIHEISVGKIRAAIWANRNSKNETWYSVTIGRAYYDGRAWQESRSFGRDDLPLAAKVLEMAYAWIWGQSVTARPNGHSSNHAIGH